MSFYPISAGGGSGSGLTPVYIDNTDSPYTAIAGSVISADTTAAAITINLPPSGSDAVIFIKDYKYNAATFNITITPNGADTINSQSSLVLDTNGAYLGLSIAAGQTDWDAFVLSDNTDAVAFNNRNRLINGDMSHDQRNSGASQVITAGAAKAYTVDRWYAYATGANVTGQQVAGSAQSQYRYRFAGATSNTAIQFGQRIEAANSYDLNGQTCTLSVDLANNILTEVAWTVYYANTTDAFGTIASPTRTLIDTGTFTGVGSTVARYSAQITVPVAATTGLEIVFSVANQISGTWTIGDVQFELGAVATDFEQRDDLIRCLRYYEIFSGADILYFFFGATTAAVTYLANIPVFPKFSNSFTISGTPNADGAGFILGTITLTPLNNKVLRAQMAATNTGVGYFGYTNLTIATEL